MSELVRKAEMCKYCVGTEAITLIEFKYGRDYEILDLNIRNNKLIANYDAYSCDSSFDANAHINFCPMCGQKLEEDEDGKD